LQDLNTPFEGNVTWVSIYNLDKNKWSQTYALEDNRYTEHPVVEQNQPVLYRDALYFMLEMHDLEGEEVRAALRFDLGDQKLSVVLAPENAYTDSGMFLATSEGFAFAGTAADDDEDVAEGNGQNKISVWTLSDDTPPVWSLTSEIDLETILPVDAINSAFSLSAVGFIEGEETICIDSGERIFTVEVQSKRTRDIGPSGSEFVLAFLHFHMPTWRKAEDIVKRRGSPIETPSGKEAKGGQSPNFSGAENLAKAEDIVKRIGFPVETPSGKKAKGGQSQNFSGAEN